MEGYIMYLSQESCALSASKLWQYQRDFFSQEGINAWAGKVPFYVTSNPYIANAYANVVFRFMQDYAQQKTYHADEPFYILELGTGSGKFSFYFLKKLLELQKELRGQHIHCVYVMTDFTRNNIDFWQNHPSFQDYLKQGILDFAIYDLEHDEKITLLQSKKVLSAGSLANPLTVFANYIFDTVSHDAFSVSNGKLREGLVQLTTPKNNIRQKQPIDLEKISAEFLYSDAALPYYYDEKLNELLAYYAANFSKLNFLLPKGALMGINNLRKIANDKLLLLATDKGYIHADDLSQQGEPNIAWHGSFSMMVNFHAIARYFQTCGGNVYCQARNRETMTAVFALGMPMLEYRETTHAISNYIQNLSPNDIFNMHTHMKYSAPARGLETLLSHMNLTGWDPHIFGLYLEYILSELQFADYSIAARFVEGAQKLADNFYYLPNNRDTLAELGLLLQTIGKYQEAIDYYRKSLDLFGESTLTLGNIGVCNYCLGKMDTAIVAFEKVAQLGRSGDVAIGDVAAIDANVKNASEWLLHLYKLQQQQGEKLTCVNHDSNKLALLACKQLHNNNIAATLL
jgi:tetratricopeptide (TPR) repeat protein